MNEVVLGQAATLARRGRYSDAVRLLADLTDGRAPTGAEHDLLARIHAQQGRYDDAERHWRAVIEGGGPTDEAAAGLHRLARVRARRDAGTRVRAGGAAAALVAVAAAGLGGGWWLGHDSDGGGVTVTSAVATPAAAGTAVSPGQAPAQAPGGPVPPAARPISPTGRDGAAGLASRLAGPGVTVERVGGQDVVVFSDALFAAGDTASARGRAALTDLGTRLSALTGVAVEIVGHSDSRPVRPGGPFPDNAAVSLARAASAARILRQAGVPAAALTISAADDALAPYPDTPTDDARNRTVTLRVTPPS
ncbi:OmpA family protein [Frankia sp. AiPs1]